MTIRSVRLLVLTVVAIAILPRAHAAGYFDTLPLSAALDDLAERSGAPIVYSTSIVLPGMRVEPAGEDASLDETLQGWLSQWGLAYRRVHGIIVIEPAASTSHGMLIAGVARRSESGTPVAGITVGVQGGVATAISDGNGRFLLVAEEVKPAHVMLHSSGWSLDSPAEVIPGPSGIAFVELALTETAYALDRIEVSPSVYRLDVAPVDMRWHLSATDMDRMPKLGGEAMRSVGYLPGVMQNGASARAHLRGGTLDETLYLFDGIQLYDPFHLRDYLAPFSFLDTQRIGSATVQLSSYPARYGDRASGLIAFEPVAPAREPEGEVDISVFDTSVLVSGTSSKGGTSWLASARRGHLDLLLDALNDDAGSPTYFDSYLALKQTLTPVLALDASFLGARDRIVVHARDDEQSARADYDDRYYWLRATLQTSPAFEATVTTSSAVLAQYRHGSAEHPEEFAGRVDDRAETTLQAVNADFTWRVSQQLRLRGGIGLERREAEFDYHAERTSLGPLGTFAGNGDFERDFERDVKADAQHLYLEMRNRLSKSVFTEIGVRTSRQSYPGEGETRVDPRGSIAWEATERLTLRLAGGRYSQAMPVQDLRVEDANPEYAPPKTSYNMVAGADWRLGASLSLRTELYSHHTADPWPRSDNLLDPRSLVVELEGDRVTLAPASSRVHGVETTLAYGDRAENIDAWLTLEASRATDRIDGADVPRQWNPAWRIEGGVSLGLGEWDLRGILHVAAGLPATALTLQQSVDDIVLTRGEFNGDRLPASHGLDLRASREWRSGNNAYTFYIEAVNAYNGPNPCCVDYAVTRTPEGTPRLKRRLDDWYGLVPNIGFRWHFD